MEFDVRSLGIDVPGIDQVGIVVEDLEDGMDRFAALLGVEPWAVHRFEPPALTDTTYEGRPTEMSHRLAIATVGDIDLELIEPLEGENTYTAHLTEHGEGLHHVACFSFDDPRGVVETFEDDGIPVVQSGIYNGATFWYIDTRAQMNGVLFEVVESAGDGPSEPDRVYPE